MVPRLVPGQLGGFAGRAGCAAAARRWRLGDHGSGLLLGDGGGVGAFWNLDVFGAVGHVGPKAAVQYP